MPSPVKKLFEMPQPNVESERTKRVEMFSSVIKDAFGSLTEDMPPARLKRLYAMLDSLSALEKEDPKIFQGILTGVKEDIRERLDPTNRR